MEFDIKQVYTCINADKLKVGSRVICATCLANLKEYVADYFNAGTENTCIVTSILDDTYGDSCENERDGSLIVMRYHFPKNFDSLDKVIKCMESVFNYLSNIK